MAASEAAPPPQSTPPAPSVPASLSTAAGIVLAIAALYFGRDFFIPFALAGLLAFALSPIISWLRRWHVPRVPAVLLAVMCAFTFIGGLSFVIASQLVSLATSIPEYEQTIIEKVRSLRDSGSTEGGVLDRLTSTIEGFRRELSNNAEDADAPPDTPSTRPQVREPIPVTIEPAAESPLTVLRVVFAPLLGPLITMGVVVVFVIFVLLERESLRDRFLRLVGTGDLQTSTEALREAGSRVSRYLLMQLAVNVTYGVPLGIGLYVIGVPNAVLWGLLAIVLRFIPYLGPVFAAIFPLALSFAVDPGWSMLLMVLGLFLVLELVSNNFIEPWLYGASTGLSALAIISAAIFWTTLWGPVGLMLSTPLTVCLVVIGRYVPQLQFLGVLLGSDDVLRPEEQLYQRLLSGNIEAAVEMAETYVSDHSFFAFYDQVAIPALRLAESDRQRNVSDGSYRGSVAEGMVAVLREIAEHADQRSSAENGSDGMSVLVPRSIGVPDLCIGGRTDLDCAAAEMVAQAAEAQGIGARVLPPVAISQQAIGQLDLRGVEVVCLSYFADEPQSSARFACRRLKKRAPHIKIVICLWSPSVALTEADDLRKQTGADAVVFSVEGAAAQINAWVAPHPSDPMQPPAIPEDEQERLHALRKLGLATGESEYFDAVAAKVAAAFGTPIALVTLVDEEHQLWPGAVGLAAKLDACRMDARETSICGHVVAANDLIVIEDTAKDPRFANNPFLIENGIRFYAGAPLRTGSGHAIGSLCVIDTAPRTFSERDREILRKIADDLMVRVEAECQRTQGQRQAHQDHAVPAASQS